MILKEIPQFCRFRDIRFLTFGNKAMLTGYNLATRLLVLILLLGIPTACTRIRKPASGEIPPLVLSGPPAHVPADEVPLVKTDNGYVPSPLPGVPTPTPTPLKYIKYTGPSN